MRAEGLVKVFGATRALSGVDVAFSAGEVTVIEGPNGSGKSTLVAILAQLMRPTRGKVLYGEHDARTMGGEVRRHVGVLAHAAMLYPDLSGKENLQLFAGLYGIANPDQRVAELVDRFEIGRFGDRPARTYSRGQLQRIALARALVHAPRLLLLDEPSTGLDSRAVDRLVQAVQEQKEAGTIQLLVTHDPSLAERLADRRVRLRRGRVAEVTS